MTNLESKLDIESDIPDTFDDDTPFDDASYFEEESTAFFSSGIGDPSEKIRIGSHAESLETEPITLR